MCLFDIRTDNLPEKMYAYKIFTAAGHWRRLAPYFITSPYCKVCRTEVAEDLGGRDGFHAFYGLSAAKTLCQHLKRPWFIFKVLIEDIKALGTQFYYVRDCVSCDWSLILACQSVCGVKMTPLELECQSKGAEYNDD